MLLSSMGFTGARAHEDLTRKKRDPCVDNTTSTLIWNLEIMTRLIYDSIGVLIIFWLSLYVHFYVLVTFSHIKHMLVPAGISPV